MVHRPINVKVKMVLEIQTYIHKKFSIALRCHVECSIYKKLIVHLIDIKLVILISNFCLVLNVACFLQGNSPASKLYTPTFRNTLSVHIGAHGLHVCRYPPQPVSVLRPPPHTFSVLGPALTLSPSFRLAQAIFEPNHFPYEYPKIFNPSYSSYLPAYEDGTDRVFQNFGI